ncbi:hypothetical protein SCG7086_BL_00050 [Chlamydiales bacterium SCGC AG-110-P3]|nr:hypothetical protein SCG7086_BL_00050 [Chlamydiales bacterium SCGC AG-110-P3]
MTIDSNAFFLPQVRSLDGREPSHLLLYLEQLTGSKGRQQAGYRKSESKLSALQKRFNVPHVAYLKKYPSGHRIPLIC